MRKRCSKNGPPEAEPSRTSDEVPAHGAEIPQPYQHGVYVEITDASNISVSVTLWQDRFRLQNSHGWVVPYEEEDGAAHFAGAENVHIFAYGQCVLVPHTALRPISIRAYSISLKDLTLSYRSRSAFNTHTSSVHIIRIDTGGAGYGADSRAGELPTCCNGRHWYGCDAGSPSHCALARDSAEPHRRAVGLVGVSAASRKPP